jgi:hypothetical protein
MGYVRAYFDNSVHPDNKPNNTKDIIVKIYNGKEKGMPGSPSGPSITPKIDDNDSNQSVKHMDWKSKELPLEVIRLMYYEDKDGGLYNPKKTIANRNAKRDFFSQNEADLAWGVAPGHLLEDEYRHDRELAKARNYTIGDAQKAVFASDVSLQTGTYPYPVMSGYYFDPAGTYTFTLTTKLYRNKDTAAVATVQYNDTDGATPEHQRFVKRLIESFRYESSMVYINPRTQEAVGIDNSGYGVVDNGRGYAIDRGPGLDKAYVGFAGNELVGVEVTKAYTKDSVVELAHSIPPHAEPSGPDNQIDIHYHIDIPESVTDRDFQYVLEGYALSGTRNSRSDYKYTEYVADSEHVYIVTETTIVTIRVKAAKNRLYTHARMRNGNYYVRAYSADIDLRGIGSGGTAEENEFWQLAYLHNASANKTLRGYVLDAMEIQVVGSLYGDRR